MERGPRERDSRIKLDQLLKREGVADTGGQAKILIQAGEVRVNGEVETRRGRRLNPGDVVETGDQRFVVAAPADGRCESGP